MTTSQELFFDLVRSDELLDAHAIELEGFPPEEAADLEKFKFRQEQAPDLFLGVFIPQDSGKRKIIGYICSTLSPSVTLTHDSMYTHVAGSPTVCIHSVCVDNSWRKKRVATQLLREYLSRLRSRAEAGSVPYERVVLISHEKLIPFYENAGFTNMGTSEVVYGSSPWYELRAEIPKNMTEVLGSTDNAAGSTPSSPVNSTPKTYQQVPEGVWDALLRSSPSGRTGRLLSSFDSIVSVTTQTASGSLMNKFDLLCPREGCGSIILKEGVGKWVERASEQPPEMLLSPLLSPLPCPDQTTSWWLITPSPMAFENISFSKSVGEQGSRRRKLLGCAECEIGPLGWNEEGGKEFWLACSRVAYRI